MSLEAAFEVGRLYHPLKRIADVLTAAEREPFIKLPGVIGYFPMSSGLGLGKALNHLGGMPHLNQQGTCPIGYDGQSYRLLGDGVNYLYETTTYGLLGTETWIDSTIRGFTIGAWVSIVNWPAVDGGIITKMGVSGDYSYALTVHSDGAPMFTVSVNGTAYVAVTAPATSLTTWHFIVGRFTPSTELAIFVDGVKTVNTTSIPASCFATTQQFEVGRYINNDDRIIHAKVRDVFICQSTLSDAGIETLRLATSP